MPKQKKGEATSKDISLLDSILRQKQLSHKISSKTKWQDSIKTVKSGIKQFEKSVKAMHPIKITKHNAYEVNQKAITLKMNLDTHYNKILHLKNSDLNDIMDVSPEEKLQFLHELDGLEKAIKHNYSSHLRSLRKFLIGDSVLQLEAEANHLQFMLDQIQNSQNMKLKSQQYFLKESNDIIQKANKLSKELFEFENMLYNAKMQNIKKIATNIQHAIKALTENPSRKKPKP